jgi:L-ascorbate metabolism protein UlaG (beta-lactamase superfamily)
MTEIKWLGWSSFKVKISGKTIYFDPVTDHCDQPADFVFISHSHSDHTNNTVLARIRKPGTMVFTSVENCTRVDGIGLEPGKSRQVDDLKVTACHAYNIVRMRAPGAPFHPRGFGVGWLIETGSLRLYHPGDTELIPEMNHLGPVDVMFVPVSGIYVMDVEEAANAVKLIRPKLAIPMHYGLVDTLDGTEKTHYELDADPEEFARKLEGISEVAILKPGGSVSI